MVGQCIILVMAQIIVILYPQDLLGILIEFMRSLQHASIKFSNSPERLGLHAKCPSTHDTKYHLQSSFHVYENVFTKDLLFTHFLTIAASIL